MAKKNIKSLKTSTEMTQVKLENFNSTNPDVESMRREFVFKETATKKIYYFIDVKKNINQLSKEVFSKDDKIIHYPIGYNGGPKYKNIKAIELIGFNGLEKNPPVGIYKSINYGYGFTKVFKSFAVYLDEKIKLKKVIIKKDCKPGYDRKNKIMYFNQDILARLKDVFESLEAKYKRETEQQVTTELNIIFPKDVKRNIIEYMPDSIFLSIERWNSSIKEFSEKDKIAINDLFDKLSLRDDFLSNESLEKTKKIIDTKYIDSCYKEYSSLMRNQKDTPALEKKWQIFIKEKSWIFFYIFSQPIILYKDEAYVGGKNIDNKNGKFVDFLGKNNQTNNISFLEVKTHKTKLLKDRPYRGLDVFCISDELSGAINQVLDQRDNLQKHFFELQVDPFKQFNSACMVLIGSICDLTENQKKSFELFRSNSKDVEIITYDELLDKIKLFQDLMKRNE